MDTWYYSPYPEPYASLEKLHVCEFCLKYFGKEKTLIRHMAKCEMRHPPGDEIYRSPPEPKSPGYCKTPIAVFEVCGRTNKVCCANGTPLLFLAAALHSTAAAAPTGKSSCLLVVEVFPCMPVLQAVGADIVRRQHAHSMLQVLSA